MLQDIVTARKPEENASPQLPSDSYNLNNLYLVLQISLVSLIPRCSQFSFSEFNFAFFWFVYL